MIKIYARAIVPTNDGYVLMGEPDKDGEVMWDLPGGQLEAGKDVKQLLKKHVLQNTGYTINDLKFFEIVCKVQPKTREQLPATIIDFIFTSTVDTTESLKEAEKETELLTFDKFAWLDSGHRFNLNKTMNLLSRYHEKNLKAHDAQLKTDTEPAA